MVKAKRAPGTAPGDWFIDDRCINCGATRHVAPDLIVERDGFSVFDHQPRTPEELQMAWLATEICPTRSVRNESGRKPPKSFYPHELSPDIYLCGHNARASYGAHSYLIKRDEGNLMIDSPVFIEKLVTHFEQMGGLTKIILSHGDDVADTKKWASHFGAEIYIHRKDLKAAPYATHIIEGDTPCKSTEVSPDLLFIPVPGHTEGSMALLFKNTFLFTGDSLSWSQDDGQLNAFRTACWYSWAEQKRSLSGLAQYSFEQIFAGHGSWSPRFKVDAMRRQLLELVEHM